MRIGYARVSKADGGQPLDLQRDALAGAGAEIDTTTAAGRLSFGSFAALAGFERELIAERIGAGLDAARARGPKGGRPRKMDVTMLRMAMTAMADRKTHASDLARRLGITTTHALPVGAWRWQCQRAGAAAGDH